MKRCCFLILIFLASCGDVVYASDETGKRRIPIKIKKIAVWAILPKAPALPKISLSHILPPPI